MKTLENVQRIHLQKNYMNKNIFVIENKLQLYAIQQYLPI